MAYIVDFGDNKISDYCTVLNVKRSVLPSRSNFSKQIPTMDGSYFTGSRYEERKISLEIAILTHKKEDYIYKVSQLAKVLDVKTPSKLIIDDEPYKCYYAVLDGSTDLSKFAQTGRANLDFICHDPVAYSLYWNTYAPNEKGIFSVESWGTTKTYPVIDVDFRSKGCFFQLTNPLGQTVLIGAPKDATKPSLPLSDIVADDNCEDSASFVALPDSLLDSNRKTTGASGVGINGTAMTCTNYGTGEESKWTGVAFKRNLGQNVSEFEVTADLIFSSEGKNYEPPKPSPPPAPKPPPTPPNKPNNNTNDAPASSLGTYKVVNCGGLWINREPNTRHPLHAMSPGETIYPTEVKGKWYKHTKKYKFGTYTGWSYGKYLKKISSKGKARTGVQAVKPMTFAATTASETDNFAENQLGIIEIYGFGQNGEKLFKMSLEDTNQFFEYVDPKFYIGNKLVLDDGKNTPTPRKVDVKDNDGKVTGKEEVASGVFGDYNDFEGQLVVRRERNSNNEDLWTCEIRKIKNGKWVAGMSTSNAISNKDFPKAELNYIGVFIGRYGDSNPVSVVGVDNIKVKRLNMKTDQAIKDNLQIFDEGDHMQIDFAQGLVTLNDQPILNKLDIGSEFFTIPAGQSEFLFKTDATDSLVVAGFQDRFI